MSEKKPAGFGFGFLVGIGVMLWTALVVSQCTDVNVSAAMIQGAESRCAGLGGVREISETNKLDGDLLVFYCNDGTKLVVNGE